MGKAIFMTVFLTSVVTLAIAFFAFNGPAKKATLVVTTDSRCNLSINGTGRGWLEVKATVREQVEPGEQLIECSSDGRHADQTETVEANRQTVVQLVLPPKARFERIAEGIGDNEQSLVWAESDNGSDISWNDAMEYCSNLGSGWRLPSSAALVSVYDASGKSPVPYAYGNHLSAKPATPLIKISGLGYSSREKVGYGSSEAWSVSLHDGGGQSYPVDFPPAMRALCVRPTLAELDSLADFLHESAPYSVGQKGVFA